MLFRRRSVRVAATLVLLIGLGISALHYWRALQHTHVRDAVQTIAMSLQATLQDNPNLTAEQIREHIVGLGKGSVIHVWYDSNGQTADAWGTPLQIEIHRDQANAAVSCRSAGPDRTMGNDDDIHFVSRR